MHNHIYISEQCSQNITKVYSTSFSIAVKLLSKSIRKHIYNIYGFVRIADEIVDSFHDYPKQELLNNFNRDYKQAIAQGISINPVLHAFQYTINLYNVDQQLIEAFIQSMEADLLKQNYQSPEELKTYVNGSAEVVGLMCLKIFVQGNQQQYEQLKPYAIALGSAFQKVNFLRDLKDDYEVLKRSYFPKLKDGLLTQDQKESIELEIEQEFDTACKGIYQLPNTCKLGVYVAYKYYSQLLKKIKNTSTEKLLSQRIRISNFTKIIIVIISMIQYPFLPKK
jgi:15-cis-phytoene synthase